MPTERSDQVYAYYLEASQKFDYFVAGVSLAIVGYLGSTIQPARISLNASSLELFSLVLILVSAYCGIKRIEAAVVFLGLMHRRLYTEEAAGTMVGASSRGTVDMINESTGEVLSAAEAMWRAAAYGKARKEVKERLTERAASSGRWYLWRNGLLFGGLAGVIAARIFGAYGL